MLSVIFASMLTVAAEPSAIKFSQRIKQHILFKDDFESYTIGSFPSASGWELWFNGAGDSYQKIVDNTYTSPTKSLQLLGRSGWAAFAALPFETDSPMIGFQANVKVTEIKGSYTCDARLSFTKRVRAGSSVEYAPVEFMDNGQVVASYEVMQSYEINKWYKVMLLLNKKTDIYSVWIDDVLVGKNLKIPSTGQKDHLSYEIEAFSVSQIKNNVIVYFDDVKIFS